MQPDLSESADLSPMERMQSWHFLVRSMVCLQSSASLAITTSQCPTCAECCLGQDEQWTLATKLLRNIMGAERQALLLQHRITALEGRLEKAMDSCRIALIYSLSNQLEVYRGVLDMYLQYYVRTEARLSTCQTSLATHIESHLSEEDGHHIH